mmetsp:Transcript_36360/g.90709  ORF Transcript_36360/g.90709 Transcript_36360/m.90709 type:complete len:347 (-) Transcript_36360:119-1159(-)
MWTSVQSEAARRNMIIPVVGCIPVFEPLSVLYQSSTSASHRSLIRNADQSFWNGIGLRPGGAHIQLAMSASTGLCASALKMAVSGRGAVLPFATAVRLPFRTVLTVLYSERSRSPRESHCAQYRLNICTSPLDPTSCSNPAVGGSFARKITSAPSMRDPQPLPLSTPPEPTTAQVSGAPARGACRLHGTVRVCARHFGSPYLLPLAGRQVAGSVLRHSSMTQRCSDGGAPDTNSVSRPTGSRIAYGSSRAVPKRSQRLSVSDRFPRGGVGLHVRGLDTRITRTGHNVSGGSSKTENVTMLARTRAARTAAPETRRVLSLGQRLGRASNAEVGVVDMLLGSAVYRRV